MQFFGTILLVNIMEIKRLVVGELRENCYIVTKNNKALIIDPGDDAKRIIDACKDYQVISILVTHHHFDHIGALDTLEDYYQLKHNLFFNQDFSYEVIPTPGHTSDSLTFYFERDKVMFTGDFLFYHTCGRYDLETSSHDDMAKSLEFIRTYPDDIEIFPGHGCASFLGHEKKYFSSYI